MELSGAKASKLQQDHVNRQAAYPAFLWPLVISVSGAAFAVVLAVTAYFTYKWYRLRKQHIGSTTFAHSKTASAGLPQVISGKSPAISTSSVQISQSSPDLRDQCPPSPDIVQNEQLIGRAHYKTVIKQTTMPAVSQRHETFHRQLSHKLEVSGVEFSIHSVKYKEQPVTGHLKPELYRDDSKDSTTSTLCGSTENVANCGKLHFAYRYCHNADTLIVRVIKAEDLPAKDFSGTSDPYVKIYLLPDRKHKYQTKIHRKTLNPDFNQTFTFQVSHHEIGDRVLQFSVYDFDRFSRHDLIGVVLVRDLASEHTLGKDVTNVRDIVCVNQEQVELGELMMSLCYLPTAGRLSVTINKARNLKPMDLMGASDPYVKVSLMCHGRRIKKKKTSVKKATLCPVYNEVIVFDVPQESIEAVSLIIKVLDYDRLGSNELMGCCVVGPDYMGRDHWYEMLSNPRKPIAQWYILSEPSYMSSSMANGSGRSSPALSCQTGTGHICGIPNSKKPRTYSK